MSGGGRSGGNSLGATVDTEPLPVPSPSPTTSTILHSAAEVSPEWLTAALRDSGVLGCDAAVVGFEMTPIGTGQMADTTRFSLSVEASTPPPAAREHSTHSPANATATSTTESPAPRSVVGKFASADDQSRGTGLALRAYEIEVRFYREVARRVATRVPVAYTAEIEPDTGWFTLLLEDIVGGVQGDQIEACGPDTAAAVLDEMAGLHAPCWEDPGLAALEWLNRNSPETDTMLNALVSSLLPGFLERYADALAPEHQEVCRLFAEHLPVWLRLRTGPSTATHGDFRLDNLLFQPGNPRPVVVDWQTVAWGGASVDVAYFIGGCLSVEDRRAHESDLLAHYHRSLSSRGVTGYSLDQLHEDYRRDAFAGILMAIVASMVVQRTERGDLMFLTSATRHAQHALDLDAITMLVDAAR
jgi:hypothetical protein